MIRAIFFDLGDTLVIEEPVEGKHLSDVVLQKVPHLDEVLTELKKRGYKLGIITNTTTSREEHVRQALRKIGAEKYFNVVVTSIDIGHEKPDERIFMTALRKVRVKPGESVMVGNRISADVVGGNRMGMKTILFKWNKRYPEKTTSADEKPTRTIRSLEELPIVIQEISVGKES